MKRLLIYLIVLLSFFVSSNAQWNLEWSSPSTSSMLYSGWLDLEASENISDYNFYIIDESSIKIMDGNYSSIALYQYDFTNAEILAGYSIYSLSVDLTGDGIVEFYVTSYYGSTDPYRQSFKILDITTGNILLEKNNSSYYYSYPVIWDVDNDGSLECAFTVYDYPNFVDYNYEIYDTGIATGVSPGEKVPAVFDLRQNYPNPFNPSTTIEFDLRKEQNVSLNVYNILGQRVSTILNKRVNQGKHSINFDGENLPSGTYFYELNTNENRKTKKMTLIK